MKTRTVWLVSLAGVVGTGIALTAAFYGSIEWIERLRVEDAGAAFQPLVSLRCQVLSQPIAFHRYCHYIVEFPPTSRLSDANVAALQSLNRLPAENALDLVVASEQVTDASLPVIVSLTSLEALDVTRSGISDAGIEEIKRRLPQTIVVKRTQK